VDDKILDADHGVKGPCYAAAKPPLTPRSASKQESPRDPGRPTDPLRVKITALRH